MCGCTGKSEPKIDTWSTKKSLKEVVKEIRGEN